MIPPPLEKDLWSEPTNWSVIENTDKWDAGKERNGVGGLKGLRGLRGVDGGGRKDPKCTLFA